MRRPRWLNPMRSDLRTPNGNDPISTHVFLPATIERCPRYLSVRTLILGIVLFSGQLLQAAVVDPPSLRCASVTNTAGDVMLTWVPPLDPTNEFLRYEVYHSSVQAGPYSLITQIPFLIQDTHLHLAAGAESAAQFYYLVTVNTSSEPSLPSDTLSTIFLSLTQSNPLGSAVLDWNLLHTPPLLTSENWQGVELEYPINSWNEIALADTMARHFEQVITICEDSLTYRIRVPDASGCVSFSNVAGDVFSDVTAPTPPLMVNVTVDTATNQTFLDWDPSPEPDTDGWIVFLITEGGNIILDTLYDESITEWTWPGSSAGEGAEFYTIAAFDTCLTGNPLAPNTSATEPPYGTIFVGTTYDGCGASVNVQWTPFVGWAVDTYELYVRADNGPAQLLGSFPPSALSFMHDGVSPFTSYCYVVKGIGTQIGDTTLSNQHCRVTDYPPVPQWNYLRNVTVVGEDHIQIVDSVDGSASVRRYRLERTFNGEPWEEIAVAPSTSAPTLVFEDLDVDTDLRSYSYRVVVEDSCGVEAVVSNTGNSILLVAEPGIDGINRLRWNGYDQWAGLLAGFTVYRSIGGEAPQPIAFNPPGVWELDDDVNAYVSSNGRFCYYVEARESGNPSLIDAVSISNEACAVQQEAMWIPNAFIAGGINNVFLPVPAFVDVLGYELVIYNRWGQSIWESADRDEGWDGKVNDSYVPQGVYAFYCGFFNGAGKKVEQRGTVTFLCCP